MSSPLDQVLDRDTIRELAGARSWERGVGYFDRGAVRSLIEDRGTITAKVMGTHPYQVKLWAEGDELGYSCSCPLGVDSVFCKHCVATGLAWLDEDKPSAPATPTAPTTQRKAEPAVTMEDVRKHLAEMPQSELIEMIVEQAKKDDRLCERLFLQVARHSEKGINVESFRDAIDRAFDTGGLVDYRGMYDFSEGASEVVDSIRELLKDGHAEAVIELAEHALEAAEGAMQSVDDSDGSMGGLLGDLQEMHLAACKQAKPDPEELAGRLFEWEVNGDWDVFSGAASTYADVLGEKGLAVYRQLAEAEWSRLPTLKPGQDDSARYGKRFRITHIMENLASQQGDVEALVAIKSRDLSLPYAFLEIAGIYKSARQYDKALDWAERGWKAFPQRKDDRLREFLADEYHRRKRHTEAMALIWEAYAASPSLHDYENLAEHARRVDEWPVWRERALGFLREEIARAKAKGSKRKDAWWGLPTDHSELARIFLWEKDADAAWHEAQQGGCSEELWLQLADQRGKDHPEDAFPIYRKRVERVLQGTGDAAYHEAIEMLRKMRRAMQSAGRPPQEFGGYLEALRTEQKRKRNFIAMLKRAKLD